VVEQRAEEKGRETTASGRAAKKEEKWQRAKQKG